MNKLWIIIKEVYRKNVRSWSFFWMVFGPILMVVGIGTVVFFIVKNETENSFGELAVIVQQEELAKIVEENNQKNTLIWDYSNVEDAKEALDKGNIDAYLVVKEDNQQIKAQLYKETTGKNIDLSSVEKALDNLQLENLSKQIGLDKQQLASIQKSNVSIENINISESKDGETVETAENDPKVIARKGIAYFSVFIVFMFIMNYSSIISQEIANEKGSRIMEIILSSVDASTHFFGKMIGILLVILTQVVIYGVIYWVLKFVFFDSQILEFLKLPTMDITSLTGDVTDILIYSLGFALLGIMTYSCLSGFLGSLVTKTEDVNKVLSPIMLFAVAGLYIGIFAMQSPNNMLVRVGSHFPLMTPFIIPFRIATETIAGNELVIAFIVSILFSILSLWIASMFYKSNVLTHSDKGIINTLKRSYTLWKSEKKAQQN